MNAAGRQSSGGDDDHGGGGTDDVIDYGADGDSDGVVSEVMSVLPSALSSIASIRGYRASGDFRGRDEPGASPGRSSGGPGDPAPGGKERSVTYGLYSSEVWGSK